MGTRRLELKRRTLKSSEEEFIWELENSYELSPKLSEQILLSAKESLAKQYTVLLNESKKDKVGRENIKHLLESLVFFGLLLEC